MNILVTFLYQRTEDPLSDIEERYRPQNGDVIDIQFMENAPVINQNYNRSNPLGFLIITNFPNNRVDELKALLANIDRDDRINFIRLVRSRATQSQLTEMRNNRVLTMTANQVKNQKLLSWKNVSGDDPSTDTDGSDLLT